MTLPIPQQKSSRISQILVVQWPRFGPYHLARLKATAGRLRQERVQLVALEIAGQDAIYKWKPLQNDPAYERITLFPEAKYDTLGWRRLWPAIGNCLDVLQPTAVAICGYTSPAAQVLLSWCRLRGRPAILMSESKADDDPRRRFWKEWPKKILAEQFDAALCGGRPHQSYLEQLGMDRKQIFLGYDVVDNDYFRHEVKKIRRLPDGARPLPGLGSTKPFFLASARFIQRKNLENLLGAYHLYRQQVEPDQAWRLVILGDGPERSRLEQLIRQSNIPDTCLPGFRQIEELPAYYGLAGAFIHPALQEQWGLVVNEAMAAGLPVLVSERCGCVPDLIDPGRTGLLFNPADIEELTRLMMRASSDNFDRQTMSAAAQAHIGHWGPDRFAEGMLATVTYVQERAI